MSGCNLALAIAGSLCLAAFPAAAPALAAPPSVQPAMPQWLGVVTLARPALLDPAKWTPADARVAEAHFNYWKNLRDSGVTILAGRTQDVDADGHMAADGIGLLIFRAPDRAAAEAILAADPAIASRLFRSRLSAYQVALIR
jgi:uncharacterized protein YciI